MASVLITGANRGLGLEFCRQYAADNWTVIACCRTLEQASALTDLAGQYPNIQLHRLDVADFSQIDALSDQLSSLTLDILINNAGVYDDDRQHGFGQLDYSAWHHSFQINSLAPVKMAESFLPQLKRSDKRLLVTLTSLMGSIADNQSGGSLLYRSSKAAVNAAMKSLALDLHSDAIGVLLLHPGWVKTDMGGSNAPMSTMDNVSAMRKVIAQFSLKQSGAFLRYDGKTLPW